jgi:hypothetical protein
MPPVIEVHIPSYDSEGTYIGVLGDINFVSTILLRLDFRTVPKV